MDFPVSLDALDHQDPQEPLPRVPTLDNNLTRESSQEPTSTHKPPFKDPQDHVVFQVAQETEEHKV